MHEELEDIIRELNPSVPIGEIRDRILLSIETEATNDRTAIDEELMAFKRALEIQGYYEVMNWLDEADRFEVVNVMNLMEEELNSRADL